MQKANSQLSQPSALVEFRRLLNDDTVDESPGSSTVRKIPITALGQVRIGTVWTNQVCNREALFDIQEFDVDFTQCSGAWRFVTFFENSHNQKPAPFPLQIHRPPYQVQDRSWLLEFDLASGGKVVIPCLEFFTRCYGRGSEMRRVLTTYPWDGQGEDTCMYRFFAPSEMHEEPDKAWKVNLRKRMVNDDTVFLAHAKYDRYTARAARSIYGQLEAQFSNQPKATAFLKVAPWFQGPAKMKVAGHAFENGKSFLGLQVLGCSHPAGIVIDRGRENDNGGDSPPNNDDNEGTAWKGAIERKLIKPPEIISFVDSDPSHLVTPIEIEDTDFEILGEPRTVREVKPKQTTTRAGVRGQGPEGGSSSGGEPHGTGQEVGHGAINSRTQLESKGILRDMWEAMRFLQTEHPQAIQSVRWYTFQTGFSDVQETSIISLTRFSDHEDVEPEPEMRTWVFLDRRSDIVRGILVARMMVQGKAVDFFEIQRKPRNKKSKDGDAKRGEENYKGLACVLNPGASFEGWVKAFLAKVRYARGVVDRLVGDVPGLAKTFVHQPASHDRVPCEAVVVNALRKLDIHL